MPLHRWLQRAIQQGAGPHTIQLRDLDVARAFPVQPPLDVTARTRAHAPACPRCAGPMREALITTGGPGCNLATWVAHPLAMDGWYCPRCSEVCMPRALEEQEVAELTRAGVNAMRRGMLEVAELCLRRVASSWPRHVPTRMKMALLYGQRLARAESTGAPRHVVHHICREIVLHLDDVLAMDAEDDNRGVGPVQSARGPDPRGAVAPAGDVLGLLCRALLKLDDLQGVRRRIESQLARPDLPAGDRDLVVGLLSWAEGRGDLADEAARRVDIIEQP